MQIRFAEDDDVHAIVELLKVALGETLMPKSEAYWRWKHIENPFGCSPVLLAFDGSRLVGVRAFMKWTWKSGEKIIHAVRAVDTVTHPEFQGRGIFRKLTLSLIDRCEQDGVDFIFNTPNSKSRPGYLKMGWQDAGKLPVSVRIFLPGALRGIFSGPLQSPSLDKSFHTAIGRDTWDALLNQDFDGVHTDYSMRYLSWRYTEVPVAKYGMCIANGERNSAAVAFYRIKDGRVRELRITDYFCTGNEVPRELGSQLRRLAFENGCAVITWSGVDDANASMRLMRGFKMSGPIVTVKQVRTDVAPFIKFQRWRPTLGDLELF